MDTLPRLEAESAGAQRGPCGDTSISHIEIQAGPRTIAATNPPPRDIVEDIQTLRAANEPADESEPSQVAVLRTGLLTTPGRWWA